MSRSILRGLAPASCLVAIAVATAAPAQAHCYKFKNTASSPRTLMMVGGGNFTITIAPDTTWPERGEYCVYGTNVTVKVQPGGFEGSGPQMVAGDGQTARASGTYELK